MSFFKNKKDRGLLVTLTKLTIYILTTVYFTKWKLINSEVHLARLAIRLGSMPKFGFLKHLRTYVTKKAVICGRLEVTDSETLMVYGPRFISRIYMT